MIQLAAPTDPKWVKVILDHFDEFLIDHADCERKASAMAMTFVAKCPERFKIARPLIDLALEELLHFKQVHQLMEKRGLRLNPRMHEDPYVSRLMALCRHTEEERFLDRMLVMSIVESRGAERFGILYPELGDPELRDFYRQLYLAESKHGGLFVTLAKKYYPADQISGRLGHLLQKEAELITELPWRPSLH